MTKTKRKKLPENKATTLTISILPEIKKKLLSYIGNRNQSQFVRDAMEEKIEREVKKENKFKKVY